MANTESVKQERMHILLDKLSKQRLERAATYAHKSLSEFVLGQALSTADEVIQEHEKLMLDVADWGVFLDALESPPNRNCSGEPGDGGLRRCRRGPKQPDCRFYQ